MAGGQRIDDHKAWMGARGKDSPLPMGSKMKQLSSAEGAGSEMNYEDSSEEIKKQQVMGAGKAKAHAQKPLHRN